METKENAQRIDALDALRGIAVLSIVLYHFLFLKIPPGASLKWQWIARPLGLCWIGVDLFFVLSGFLIGDIVMTHGRAKNFLSVFWLRRFCRIIPVYAVFLAAFFLIGRWLHPPLMYYGVLPAKPLWSYLAFVQNFFMSADNNFGNFVLGVTWTLAVEFQFYLVFPLILLRLPERRVPVLCAAALLFAPLFRLFIMKTAVLPHLSTFLLFPCRVDSFAAGILAAWIYRKYPEWGGLGRAFRRGFGAVFAVLLTGIAVMFIFQPRFDPVKSESGFFLYSWLALLFLCVVLAALWARRTGRCGALSNPALVSLGWFSYSLYLFHTLTNVLVHYVMTRRNDAVLCGRDLAATVLSFSFVILLSIGLREFVERPFIQWGKKLKFTPAD